MNRFICTQNSYFHKTSFSGNTHFYSRSSLFLRNSSVSCINPNWSYYLLRIWQSQYCCQWLAHIISFNYLATLRGSAIQWLQTQALEPKRWVWMLTLLLTSCVILRKLPNDTWLSFPMVTWGIKIVPTSRHHCVD